jgi:hypothetical protein
MKYVLVICYFFSLAMAAEPKSEATLEFVGVGQVRVKADYVKLLFTIRSLCYESPLEAQIATDKTVSEVSKYLHSLQEPSDKYFQILIDGGFTTAYSRWEQNKEICRNSFQKNTHVTLHIKVSDDFSRNFTDIQSKVLKNFYDISEWGTANKAQTYVSLSTPEPRIARTHRLKKEQMARNLALLDAQANAKATIKSCAPRPFKIISVKEIITPNYINNNYLQARALPAESKMTIEAAPVRFDDIIISKELVVTFELQGPLCAES